MNKEEIVTEVLRLANLYAIARVRRYAKSVGSAPLETEGRIKKRIAESKKALEDYVRSVL